MAGGGSASNKDGNHETFRPEDSKKAEVAIAQIWRTLPRGGQKWEKGGIIEGTKKKSIS